MFDCRPTIKRIKLKMDYQKSLAEQFSLNKSDL